MKVLIVNANQELFLEFDQKLKFQEASKNTCIFKITESKFVKLRDWLREKGFNPYAVMTW